MPHGEPSVLSEKSCDLGRSDEHYPIGLSGAGVPVRTGESAICVSWRNKTADPAVFRKIHRVFHEPVHKPRSLGRYDSGLQIFCQSLQFSAKLRDRHTAGTHERDKTPEPVAEVLQSCATCFRHSSLLDHCGTALPEIQPTFVRKCPIGRRNCVEVNPSLGGNAPYGGQCSTGLELTGDQQGAKPIDNLLVGRHRGIGNRGRSHSHGLTVHCGAAEAAPLQNTVESDGEPLLIAAECFHRIHFYGTTGRQVAGEEGDREEHQRRHSEGLQVARPGLVEQARHQFA